jgi:hypothetical protein
MAASCASLFSKADQAAHYSLHRPRYPEELYEAIVSRCPGRTHAVDIATGSGQAATALAGGSASLAYVPGVSRCSNMPCDMQQLSHAPLNHCMAN